MEKCFIATPFQNENMFYVQETSMDITRLEHAVKKYILKNVNLMIPVQVQVPVKNLNLSNMVIDNLEPCISGI